MKKKTGLQNEEVGVLGTAFRARKVFGTVEKRAPALFSRVRRAEDDVFVAMAVVAS